MRFNPLVIEAGKGSECCGGHVRQVTDTARFNPLVIEAGKGRDISAWRCTKRILSAFQSSRDRGG